MSLALGWFFLIQTSATSDVDSEDTFSLLGVPLNVTISQSA
jgi:hypothetical protein